MREFRKTSRPKWWAAIYIFLIEPLITWITAGFHRSIRFGHGHQDRMLKRKRKTKFHRNGWHE